MDDANTRLSAKLACKYAYSSLPHHGKVINIASRVSRAVLYKVLTAVGGGRSFNLTKQAVRVMVYLIIAAEEEMRKLINKLINIETISYVIAGILTTLVNFISYEALYRLGLSNLSSNAAAWLIAVAFAYIVNKWNVFRSKSKNSRDEAINVIKFFGARAVTLGIEQAGIYLFVELLGVYRWLIKGSLTIIVIILNYIFSKFYIFKKTKKMRMLRQQKTFRQQRLKHIFGLKSKFKEDLL